MDRREALRLLTAAAVTGVVPRIGRAADGDLYDVGRFGNVRVLHLTDTHAQLLPVFFREPSVNIGIGAMRGKPPHLVGRAFLEHFGIEAGARPHTPSRFSISRRPRTVTAAWAASRISRRWSTGCAATPAPAIPSCSMAATCGREAGLPMHRRPRTWSRPPILLGIDAMTGHWEFTYGEQTLRHNLERFKGEFLAQNVFLTEEAAFNDAPAFDPASGRVFKPATVKEIGGHRIAMIGQALPYVPVAHPERFVPDWTFGIRDAELQKLVDDLRGKERVDAVLLLSHNGMDVDLKLASRVTGIDVILGGHTHDAVPQPRGRRQCGRQDAGHQCRVERQVPGGARSRGRQGRDQGRALSPAAGLCEPAEAGSRDVRR